MMDGGRRRMSARRDVSGDVEMKPRIRGVVLPDMVKGTQYLSTVTFPQLSYHLTSI